ncbi:MAG: hypothetical protein HYS41_04600 [Candidatus Omnitrophica bacterium]|nr:hypothetical protein [Candidatus Omnitrophota bacterium]
MKSYWVSLRGTRYCFYVLLFIALLVNGNTAHADQEIPEYRTANQDPKGTGMQLVTFQPEMLLLPFEVKYPESWYVREEFGGVPSLFISREPILAETDQYKVGMTIYYHIDFFAPQKEDPNSALGQMAESVVKIRTWEGTKEGILKTFSEPGKQILSQGDAALSGQAGFRVEWKNEQTHVITYYVKAGNHLMLWTLEAPPDEFEKYSSAFKQMVEEFKFTR